LSRQGKYESAVASYRQALRVDANNATVWNNLGSVLIQLDRMDAAHQCFDKAIALQPTYARAYGNRGNLLFTLRRLDDALRDFDRALQIDPRYAEAHLQRARLRLLTNDFEQGWPEYQWKHAVIGVANLDTGQPVWKGEPLDSKTILLRAEPDLGDTLQLVRYAAVLTSQGATVLLNCSPESASLLSESVGIEQVVTGVKGSWPAFDVHATLASLPMILRTRSDSIPADIPYLAVDPERKSAWEARLGGGPERKVGLAWRISPAADPRQRPLLPVEQFGRFAEVTGLRCISLQLSPAEATTLGDRLTVEKPDVDLEDKASLLAELAAAIANLDLVVTADNAMAHLAGALGVRVWVALPYVPDWRWQLDRDDSPWYPTVRLFRQSQRGDWEDVFQRLTSALQQWAAPANTEGATETES
jgi:hypothetical protein